MLRFDDITNISDQEMRLICKQLPVPTLARALKTAPHELAQKFLRNIRPSIAEMIGDMIKKHGDISETQVDEDRAKILEIVRRFHSK